MVSLKMANDIGLFDPSDKTPEFWDNFEYTIAYWRENIHRFAEEYFGFSLRDFQKLALYQMSHGSSFMFFASRGIGKTWLCAVFACATATLYPNIKIAVAAPRLRQAIGFIEKIREISSKCENLLNEISDISLAKDGAKVKFHNGSEINAVVSNDTARGGRAQILILDECRLMDKTVVTGILEPYLTEVRDPGFMRNKKYRKYIEGEKNKKIYLTSIGTVDEWSYRQFLTNCERFIARFDRDYHAMCIPYQMGIKDGIINRQFVEQQIAEGSVNPDVFNMEMEVIPYGEADASLFSFEQLQRARRVRFPLLPMSNDDYLYYQGDVTKNPFYRRKIVGEIRFISMDIAVSAKKNSDNSVLMCFSLFKVNRDSGGYEYIKQIDYIEVMNGIELDSQIVRLKEVFYDLECDYAVIDCNGSLGITAYDLCKNVTMDYDRNVQYPAWRLCKESPEVDNKDVDPTAVPCIYAIRTAGSSANDLIYSMLLKAKIYFDRGKVNLLCNEDDCEEDLNKKYKYSLLKSSKNYSERFKAAVMISPFVNTTELVGESIRTQIVRLSNNKFGIRESKDSDRKDRVMAMIYGMHFASVLEEGINLSDKKVDYSVVYKAKVYNNSFKKTSVAFGDRARAQFSPFSKRF